MSEGVPSNNSPQTSHPEHTYAAGPQTSHGNTVTASEAIQPDEAYQSSNSKAATSPQEASSAQYKRQEGMIYLRQGTHDALDAVRRGYEHTISTARPIPFRILSTSGQAQEQEPQQPERRRSRSRSRSHSHRRPGENTTTDCCDACCGS